MGVTCPVGQFVERLLWPPGVGMSSSAVPATTRGAFPRESVLFEPGRTAFLARPASPLKTCIFPGTQGPQVCFPGAGPGPGLFEGRVAGGVGGSRRLSVASPRLPAIHRLRPACQGPAWKTARQGRRGEGRRARLLIASRPGSPVPAASWGPEPVPAAASSRVKRASWQTVGPPCSDCCARISCNNAQRVFGLQHAAPAWRAPSRRGVRQL